MILFWKVRYLDRADKQFKDRYRCLDTKTLDPVARAARRRGGGPGGGRLHTRPSEAAAGSGGPFCAGRMFDSSASWPCRR